MCLVVETFFLFPSIFWLFNFVELHGMRSWGFQPHGKHCQRWLTEPYMRPRGCLNSETFRTMCCWRNIFSKKCRNSSWVSQVGRSTPRPGEVVRLIPSEVRRVGSRCGQSQECLRAWRDVSNLHSRSEVDHPSWGQHFDVEGAKPKRLPPSLSLSLSLYIYIYASPPKILWLTCFALINAHRFWGGLPYIYIYITWRSLMFGTILLICLLQSNPYTPWWVNACCWAGREHFNFSRLTRSPITAGTGTHRLHRWAPIPHTCCTAASLHCLKKGAGLQVGAKWMRRWCLFWRFQILSMYDADLWWSKAESPVVRALRHTMQLLHSNKRLQLLSSKPLHSSKQWQWRSNKRLRSKWHSLQ